MYSIDFANIVINKDNDKVIWWLIETLQEHLHENYKTFGGFRGYKKSVSVGGVRIAYGGEFQNHTTLISISGIPLKSFGWYGLASFIRKIIRELDVTVKLTRADIAVDIKGNLWKNFIRTVYDRIEEHRINTIQTISSFDRDITPIQEGDTFRSNRFNIKNSTIYVGSRTSNRMLRCYAKNINGTPSTRFEMECKENYAADILANMLSGGTITQAVKIAFKKFVRLDDYFKLEAHQEPLVKSIKQVKIKNRENWLINISGAIMEYADQYQAEFEKIMLDGCINKNLTPYGNTGVHLPKIKKEIENLHHTQFITEYGAPNDLQNINYYLC